MDDEQINTQSYFTKEIQDSISEMSESTMLSLLKDIESTPVWIAILKYSQQRLRVTESAILYADPVKDPTLISRSQGIMLGISDLQNAVISLISQKENKPE